MGGVGKCLGEKVGGVFSHVHLAGFLPTWVAWRRRGTALCWLWVTKLSWNELSLYFGGLGTSPRLPHRCRGPVLSPVLSWVVPKQVLCSRISPGEASGPLQRCSPPALCSTPALIPSLHPILSPSQRSRGQERAAAALPLQPWGLGAFFTLSFSPGFPPHVRVWAPAGAVDLGETNKSVPGPPVSGACFRRDRAAGGLQLHDRAAGVFWELFCAAAWCSRPLPRGLCRARSPRVAQGGRVELRLFSSPLPAAGLIFLLPPSGRACQLPARSAFASPEQPGPGSRASGRAVGMRTGRNWACWWG